MIKDDTIYDISLQKASWQTDKDSIKYIIKIYSEMCFVRLLENRSLRPTSPRSWIRRRADPALHIHGLRTSMEGYWMTIYILILI